MIVAMSPILFWAIRLASHNFLKWAETGVRPFQLGISSLKVPQFIVEFEIRLLSIKPGTTHPSTYKTVQTRSSVVLCPVLANVALTWC
jgi:hypothetical protein